VNAARRAVAADVLTAAREHDAAQSDRLARFRNVEPETAELLGVLVRAVRAVRVLELGTSNGYSTIWLADGVEGVGGRIVSVDVDAERIALARDNLERAGLEADLRWPMRPRCCPRAKAVPGTSYFSTPSGALMSGTGPI
jgi:predicted O-methyltransferase YrrM